MNGAHAYPPVSAGADGCCRPGLLTVSDEKAVPANVVTAPRHRLTLRPKTPSDQISRPDSDWRSPGRELGLIESEGTGPVKIQRSEPDKHDGAFFNSM